VVVMGRRQKDAVVAGLDPGSVEWVAMVTVPELGPGPVERVALVAVKAILYVEQIVLVPNVEQSVSAQLGTVLEYFDQR
jgi:hypothetical protein